MVAWITEPATPNKAQLKRAFFKQSQEFTCTLVSECLPCVCDPVSEYQATASPQEVSHQLLHGTFKEFLLSGFRAKNLPNWQEVLMEVTSYLLLHFKSYFKSIFSQTSLKRSLQGCPPSNFTLVAILWGSSGREKIGAKLPSKAYPSSSLSILTTTTLPEALMSNILQIIHKTSQKY